MMKSKDILSTEFLAILQPCQKENKVSMTNHPSSVLLQYIFHTTVSVNLLKLKSDYVTFSFSFSKFNILTSSANPFTRPYL